MGLYRAQIIIPYDSGLPEDVMTNTLYFATGGAIEEIADAAAAITPLIQDFYDKIYETANATANYVNWPATTVRWYDVADPEPRVPYPVTMAITPGASTLSATPSEVAIVCSFHAEAVPGGNPRRRRGRIYLGGWASSAFATNASAPPTVSPDILTDIVVASETLMTDTLALSEASWCVYSPTNSTSGPLFVPVAGGWADNTPDTQRRRGVDATSRTVWP